MRHSAPILWAAVAGRSNLFVYSVLGQQASGWKVGNLREWLKSRGLERYEEALVAQDVDLDILPSLTDTDLAAAGLPVGARKRLLQAIEGRNGDADLTKPASPPSQPAKNAASPEAEWRQLTVLFCDVVSSTSLAEKLDGEDLRHLLLLFQKVCADAVQRNEGHIGLFIGDGVTAYFGYPRAYEDSAQRAVQAGLEILSGLAELAIEGLEARCGVHTGPVIVGEMGIGEKRLHDGIVGEAPNIAARLQGLAPPGGLVLSDATLRLVTSLFDVDPLGEQILKGVSSPIPVYRVLRANSVPNRFETRRGQALTALVGRETELSFLTKRWENAEDGEGQAVLLKGEAGIGKSRLLQTLRTHLGERLHQEIVFHCSPQHQSSALWPVMQQLRRALSSSGANDVPQQFERLREFVRDLNLQNVENALATLSRFLDIADIGDNAASTLEPAQSRRSLFATLLEIIASMATNDTVLLIVEDAHWLDPSTTELVGQMLPGLANQRIFLLVTARPEFRVPWSSGQLVTLPLTRLSRRETEAMIRSVAPADLSDAMLVQLAAKADGVPLFIEELTKSVTESKINVRQGTPIDIPASLQAALHTRLDRLAPIRQLVQVAALLGRVFDRDILIEVSRQSATAVDLALQELTAAELIYPLGDPYRVRYEFKHALIQDAATSTLLRNQKALTHRQIAAALLKLRSDVAERNPELLAHHLQESGDWSGALDHWQKAGTAAMSRAASKEAVSHFGNAIDCSKKLDNVAGGAERLTRLHLAMATAVMQAEGYRSAKLGLVQEDARLIAAKAGLAELECEVLISYASFFFATGRNREFLVLADEQLAIDAIKLPPPYRSGLLTTKGIAHYNRGEPQLGLSMFDKADELNRRLEPSHRILIGGADQGIVTLLYKERSLVLLGRIDEAVESCESFLKTIDQITKPFELAWAILVRCDLNLLLNNFPSILEDAERVIELCDRHGYTARKANGLLWRGLARFRLGEIELAIADTREGMLIWRGPGVVFHTPERVANLCDLLVRSGQLDEASQLLDDVDALTNGTDEASFAAECIGIRGLIAASRGDLQSAERLFESAISISMQQQALRLELRATTHLALLLARQGRPEEAETRLATVIDSFNTKHDISDLVAAREALNEIAR